MFDSVRARTHTHACTHTNACTHTHTNACTHAPHAGMSMSKYQERDPEKELAEKRRQMPFHMHITLELLESSYLTCAMLLEVPAMAANPLNPKKRMISKSFHRWVGIRWGSGRQGSR